MFEGERRCQDVIRPRSSGQAPVQQIGAQPGCTLNHARGQGQDGDGFQEGAKLAFGLDGVTAAVDAGVELDEGRGRKRESV